MNQYIRNLLPRLRQYGQKLNRIEAFADKVWTVVDEDGNLQTYRFKRNNTLRVTVNGNYTDYRWELEGLDAIAISAPGTSSGEIYRHGFVLEGILVVQKEGMSEHPTIFYDEAVVPNGDVATYIRNQLISKMQLRRLKETGEYFAQSAGNGTISLGTPVFNNELEPVNGAVINIGSKLLYVKDGRVQKILKILRFQTASETLLLHAATTWPNPGDKVLKNDTPVPDGSYTGKVGEEAYTLVVHEGHIIKVKQKTYGTVIAGFYIAFLLIVALVLGLYIPNSKNGSSEATNYVDANVASSGNTAAADTLVSATVDTSHTVYATVNTVPEPPTEEKTNRLKRIVASYLTAINNRDWSEVSRLLNINLSRYYGSGEVHYMYVLEKLREYWQNDRKTGIIYDEYEISVEPIKNGYQITVPVIERGTEGFYRTPTLIRANLYVDVNSSEYISGIHSTIENKTYDFYRMFDMDESITLADYAQRNNTTDWYRILGKIKSVSSDTPSEYTKYRQAVIDVYGDACYVTLGQRTYTLGDYMDQLARGEQTETYFFTISSSGNGGKLLSR